MLQCVFVESSEKIIRPPQSCTLYYTLYCTLHCTGSNLQCQECSQEPSLGGMNQNISSLWPPLFVNQCSILYLDPEQIDLFSILLMVFIFNAEFGWKPLVLSHKISLILILFLSNPLIPLLKYCVWNDVGACGTLTGKLENYSQLFTNCAVSQTQLGHSSNISL